MNLRDVLYKYGRGDGISIAAVKVYAKQLFISLNRLRRKKLLHADIKPDNIVRTITNDGKDCYVHGMCRW